MDNNNQASREQALNESNKSQGVPTLLVAGASGVVGYILGSRNEHYDIVLDQTVEIDPTVTGTTNSILGLPENIFGMIDTGINVNDRSNFIINVCSTVIPILAMKQKHLFYKNYSNYDEAATIEGCLHHIYGRSYGASANTAGEGKLLTAPNAYTILSTEDINEQIFSNIQFADFAKKQIRPGGTSFIATSYQGYGLLLGHMNLGVLLAYMDQYEGASLLNKLNRYNLPIGESLIGEPVATLVKRIYDHTNLVWLENRFRPVYGYYRVGKNDENDINAVRQLLNDYLSNY